MKILVLVKPGVENRYVLTYADQLSKIDGIELHLLNIVQIAGDIPTQINGRVLDNCTEFDLSGYEAEKAQNQKEIQEVLRTMDFVTAECLIGDSLSIIKHELQALNIDMILSGAHITSNMEDIFSSTFAENLMKQVHVPYLTIKPGEGIPRIRRIGIVRDFKDPQEENLEPLKFFRNATDAECVFIKINTPKEFQSTPDIIKKMKLFAEKNGLEAAKYEVYCERDKADAMKQLPEAYDLDMLAIGKVKRILPMMLLRGSLKVDAINHISQPILIY